MTGKELKSRLAKTGYLEKIASALNLPVSALIEANGDVVAAIKSAPPNWQGCATNNDAEELHQTTGAKVRNCFHISKFIFPPTGRR